MVGQGQPTHLGVLPCTLTQQVGSGPTHTPCGWCQSTLPAPVLPPAVGSGSTFSTSSSNDQASEPTGVQEQLSRGLQGGAAAAKVYAAAAHLRTCHATMA
jgi:hypothetical protein